jgi:tetratricopeptide (TPR) repeat protein
MKFEQYDIENSKSLLLALIKNEKLNLIEDKIDLFVIFICDEITPDSLKGTFLQTLQSLSLKEIHTLTERFKEEDDLDTLISKSFQIEKRRQLKKNLIQLDTELEEISFDETVTKAFQIEKREELKQTLKALEAESVAKKGKVISMRPYLKAIWIAASIILILFVWQPQHSSDKKLFAEYSNSIDNSSINDFTQTERIIEQGGLRGEEEHFRNFTFDETLQLQEAIALVRQKEFEKAKEVFNRFHIEKEKNPGLALYLSIAQLNSDDVEKAITNLEYLKELSAFSYTEETKFHLAFAYLKTGERKKAKKLLNELITSKSKFSDKAQETLNKISWF